MISFNISRKKEGLGQRVLKDSELRDESTKDQEEERDFVSAVHGTEIKGSKKKQVKKALVIPLIAKNEWRIGGVTEVKDEAEGHDRVSKRAPTAPLTLSLEEQAINEILGKDSSAPPGGDDVPLLLQNKVPEGYEQDDNMNVSLRADQSTMEDYERIPIEEFGMAMLRGMGWSKAEGIGLKNKQHVEMVEPQLRPKGLGLGASVAAHQGKTLTPSNERKEEELQFKIGAGALIQHGQDKGMYGRIEAFDEDNNRVVLKLAITGKMSGVSKFHICLVKESDYKGKSKVLNYDQYAEYKEKQESKEKDRRARERPLDDPLASSSTDKRRSKNSSSDQPLKKNSSSDYKRSKKYKDEAQQRELDSNWVRPHLKVRFIDSRYQLGKHYEKKFVVEDVTEVDRFILRSETGQSVLENICSRQVETVIPKESCGVVCILHGKQRGRVGELVDRNRKKETAVVRLPDGSVYELGYNDICEFVGDPEDYY